MSNVIYISGGSNEGDRIKHLSEAERMMNLAFDGLVIRSSFYESKSWGFEGNDFINTVWVFQSDHSALICLRILQSIELKIGRKSKSDTHYSNRCIDLDILFFGDQILDYPDLIIPHPHIQERNFVLLPLNEIAPHFIHPELNKSSRELLSISKDKTIISLYDTI